MKAKEFDRMLKAALGEANLIKYKEVLERSDPIEYSEDYMDKIRDLEERLDSIKRSEAARRKILRWKKAVYIALTIILITGTTMAVSPAARGLAAEALSFVFKIVPVGERYIVSETEENVYALTGSVTLDYEDGYIKINSAYTSGGLLKVELEGNIKLSVDNDMSGKFEAADSDGKPGELVDFDYMGESDTGKWSCFVSFKLKDEARYTLTVAGRKIPLVLAETEVISQQDYNLYDDEDLKLRIAAVTEYKDDLLKVALLTDSDYEDTEIGLPMEEAYLVTPKGQKINAEKTGGANTVYFKGKLEEGIRLILPYIDIYDNAGGSFITDKNAGFDGEVNIGGRKIIIKDLGWSDYKNNINIKKPEDVRFAGSAEAQKIELKISIDETDSSKLRLSNVFLHTNDRNEYKEDGIAYMYDDPYKYEAESEAGIFIVDDIKADVSETEINIESVDYRTAEEISILLRP